MRERPKKGAISTIPKGGDGEIYPTTGYWVFKAKFIPDVSGRRPVKALLIHPLLDGYCIVTALEELHLGGSWIE